MRVNDLKITLSGSDFTDIVCWSRKNEIVDEKFVCIYL